MGKDTTTIQVSRTTKERLAALGDKQDTYDAIINGMLDLAARVRFKEFMMSAENDLTLEEFGKQIDEMEG